MKFGIFYELQLPRPWVAGDELRLYQNALTQLETADRCGYDHAWVVEHHFLEEYSHSPSPESFLAAASQRTKNIRRRFRSSHIDQVILLNQAGKNSHEHICNSLELFAREVMPEFRAGSRTRCLEGRRHERRDPARGDRHRSLYGSLRQAGCQHRTGEAGSGGGWIAALAQACT